MKPVSSRERRLLLVLPAALIVAGYAWSKPADVKAELVALERARKTVTTPAQLAEARRKASERQAEVKVAERAISEARARSGALHATPTPSTSAASAVGAPEAARPNALALLTSLAQRHGVLVLDTGPAAGAWVPPGLSRLAAPPAPAPAGRRGRRAPPPSTQPPPAPAPGRVWRVRLVGTFGAVVRVLRAIAADERSPLPLGLSMEPGRGAAPEQHTWSLEVFL